MLKLKILNLFHKLHKSKVGKCEKRTPDFMQQLSNFLHCLL